MIYLTVAILALNLFLALSLFRNSHPQLTLTAFVVGILTIPLTGVIASPGDVSNIMALLLFMSSLNTLVLAFVSYAEAQLG
jgi:hypothetical protein